MLAIITFMAVAFLAISRREKGSVNATTDQNTARFAADAALARAEAELVATMIASNNPYNFGLLVSTNYINRSGFQKGISSYTNVNYQYPNGTPLSLNDQLRNLTNLLYSPRPPVVVSNRITHLNDFRFYLDLNRNGQYDPTIPGANGQPVVVAGVTNYDNNTIVGDPEWIGVLQKADRSHGPDNFFVSRYAYIAVPIGNTLDLNYIHNHAKSDLSTFTGDGFLRNMGVGSWEINLAAFLADLNTNQWDPTSSPYQYNTNLNRWSQSSVAFQDAANLWIYRNGGSYNRLNSAASVSVLFSNGAAMFPQVGIDGYSAGPLMTSWQGWGLDADAGRTLLPWPGADNPNHFFTSQDLFSSSNAYAIPAVNSFVSRLFKAGTNNWPNTSSYDRYTFYRLLSQLGTESAPEQGKMNLNYDNLIQRNPRSGALSATNLYVWQPVNFFTNAANRMLRAQFGFGVSNIPVYVNNTFVYSPSVHRMLQLAANMYDSIYYTNHYWRDASSPQGVYFPSVFRPQFTNINNDVYINNFVEVTNATFAPPYPQQLPLVELNAPNGVARLTQSQPDSLVFGVPLVVGAKKGFPSFNQISMQSVTLLSRRLQITRPSPNAPPNLYQTNQSIFLGISNVVGVSLWNSYSSNYTRPTTIYTIDYLGMGLTNEYGFIANLPSTGSGAVGMSISGITNGTVWPGYSAQVAWSDPSFVVPLYSNVLFQPDLPYYYLGNQFVNTNLGYSVYQGAAAGLFPQPRWGLDITNHLVCYMVDNASGRIIDYVQLNGLNDHRDLLSEIATNSNVPGYYSLWATNRMGGTPNITDTPFGVFQQILVSHGDYQQQTPTAAWYNYYCMGGPLPDLEIAQFRAFCSPDHQGVWNGTSAYNTNLIQEVPFVPAERRSKRFFWQANDPLVHFMSGDLLNLDYVTTNSVSVEQVHGPVTPLVVGAVTERYRPWGDGGRYTHATDTNIYNMAIKDPMITRSDDWQFPTNKLPTIGWLGRIHRGTPWQTVYLKSTDIIATNNGINVWKSWTGNSIVFSNGTIDASISAPKQDRLLFDLFTTAFNDNASRGQLSVNQSGLASWSALFSGVVVVTNLNNGFTTVAPAGSVAPANSPLWQLVNGPDGINTMRTNNLYGGSFKHIGDILAAPALTEQSPFLNFLPLPPSQPQPFNDEIYEWLPQQTLSLLRVGTPRFVVYAYGQSLWPAPNAIYTGSGPYFGLCTNYQITSEVATRAVLRVDGSIDHYDRNNPPHVVVESFNILPPD